MNPCLGRNLEAMDPLEWLARMSDHIPDPGQDRTIFYSSVRYCPGRKTNLRCGAPSNEVSRLNHRLLPEKDVRLVQGRRSADPSQRHVRRTLTAWHRRDVMTTRRRLIDTRSPTMAEER